MKLKPKKRTVRKADDSRKVKIKNMKGSGIRGRIYT